MRYKGSIYDDRNDLFSGIKKIRFEIELELIDLKERRKFYNNFYYDNRIESLTSIVDKLNNLVETSEDIDKY